MYIAIVITVALTAAAAITLPVAAVITVGVFEVITLARIVAVTITVSSRIPQKQILLCRLYNHVKLKCKI